MDGQNPFQPPAAPLQDSDTARLYSLRAVGWATLFGSPLAGAFIITKNLRLLGRAADIRKTWALAVVLSVVLMGLSFVLPDNLSATGFTVAQVMGMYFYAKSLYETSLSQHGEKGGAFYSNWRAVGIGLLFMAGLLIAMVPVVIWLMPA